MLVASTSVVGLGLRSIKAQNVGGVGEIGLKSRRRRRSSFANRDKIFRGRFRRSKPRAKGGR